MVKGQETFFHSNPIPQLTLVINYGLLTHPHTSTYLGSSHQAPFEHHLSIPSGVYYVTLHIKFG
jgi:hypothetical protein